MSVTVTVTRNGLLAAALIAAAVVIERVVAERRKRRSTSSSSSTARGPDKGLGRKRRSWIDRDLKPPLPEQVAHMLQTADLCYLSTFTDDHPHLSLMNFTYYRPDEVVIMSTRTDTKKYDFMLATANVALLVHNNYAPAAEEGKDSSGNDGPRKSQRMSITLNGKASIQEGAAADLYREVHLKENPDSAQFIVGENIAIIAVHIQSARICNIADEVTYWDVTDPKLKNEDGTLVKEGE